MKNRNVAATALLLLAMPVAFAQSTAPGAYGELGLAQVNYGTSVASIPSLKPTVLRAVLGYGLGENFAVEGMFGAGMSDGNAGSSIAGYTAEYKLKVESMFGTYLKVKGEVAPGFELFGRIGYAKVHGNISVTVPALSLSRSSSGDADGASWGLGAKIAMSPAVALTVDVMSYVNKDGDTATGPTFGIAYKF